MLINTFLEVLVSILHFRILFSRGNGFILHKMKEDAQLMANYVKRLTLQ